MNKTYEILHVAESRYLQLPLGLTKEEVWERFKALVKHGEFYFRYKGEPTYGLIPENRLRQYTISEFQLIEVRDD